MCLSSTEWTVSSFLNFHVQRQRSKRSKIRIQRLTGRRKRCEGGKLGKDIMELKNLKLYMENMSILEENDKLRKKATILRLENLALMSELKNK